MINIADIDEAAVRTWMLDSLAADDIASGRVPGFAVVPSRAPLVTLVAQLDVLRAPGSEVLQFDSIGEYLDSYDHHRFTEMAASAMLADAHEVGPVIHLSWDLDLIRRSLTSPASAFVFPWNVKAARALPKIGYPAYGSRGLGPNELVVVVGGRGEYVVNDKAGVNFPAQGPGVAADLVFPVNVWRVGSERPRVQRFLVDDLLQGDFIEESKRRTRR